MMKKIDFSKYAAGYLYVFRCDDGLYDYELPGLGNYSGPTPFEYLPQEIQERAAMLMPVPAGVYIKGVGYRSEGGNFILKDN